MTAMAATSQNTLACASKLPPETLFCVSDALPATGWDEAVGWGRDNDEAGSVEGLPPGGRKGTMLFSFGLSSPLSPPSSLPLALVGLGIGEPVAVLNVSKAGLGVAVLSVVELDLVGVRIGLWVLLIWEWDGIVVVEFENVCVAVDPALLRSGSRTMRSGEGVGLAAASVERTLVALAADVTRLAVFEDRPPFNPSDRLKELVGSNADEDDEDDAE
jgi:hypothetical protein